MLGATTWGFEAEAFDGGFDGAWLVGQTEGGDLEEDAAPAKKKKRRRRRRRGKRRRGRTKKKTVSNNGDRNKSRATDAEADTIIERASSR